MIPRVSISDKHHYVRSSESALSRDDPLRHNARVADRKPTDAELARRVSMLTAEHASLQAQRASTQSEILVRQGLFLTFAGVILVSLGLVAQAIGFTDAFFVIAVCTLAVVALLGFQTLLRQSNADAEDIMYVIAMNRIRGAYVELDEAVSPAFLTSSHDDHAGAYRTYYFFGMRRTVVPASAAIFLTIVTSGVVGLLGGSISALTGAGLGQSVAIGCGSAVASLLGVLIWTGVGFRRMQRINTPRYPSPPPAAPPVTRP
jgi:hypothetical protein